MEELNNRSKSNVASRLLSGPVAGYRDWFIGYQKDNYL